MPEFITYQSNRIGGNGPNSGLQYNVKAWFPDAPGLAINEDIFADTLQQRVILLIKILVDSPALAVEKSMIIRAKPVGFTPTILSPGIDIYRKNIRTGENFATAIGDRMWSGYGDVVLTGTNAGQFYVPLRLYLETNMDFNVTFNEFPTISIQMHYLTGDPDRLMQAVLS